MLRDEKYENCSVLVDRLSVEAQERWMENGWVEVVCVSYNSSLCSEVINTVFATVFRAVEWANI